ncbi:MAG: hypothetical protein CMK41_03725 [Porticoccaceae bacterium]|nr:hypothetical protein [Porticoccaceae bacterium]
MKLLFVYILLMSILSTSAGCVRGSLTPGEEAAEISNFCSSAASRLPSVDDVIVSDDNLISFGECMSDHGYIDQIHRNN